MHTQVSPARNKLKKERLYQVTIDWTWQTYSYFLCVYRRYGWSGPIIRLKSQGQFLFRFHSRPVLQSLLYIGRKKNFDMWRSVQKVRRCDVVFLVGVFGVFVRCHCDRSYSHTGKCIKCFKKHAYKDCSSRRFVLPGKTLCFKCFLPFVKGVGPDLHPGSIGSWCTSPACECLPQAAAILFHSNSSFIPSRLHGDFENFLVWLGSIELETGMHGILSLLSKLIAWFEIKVDSVECEVSRVKCEVWRVRWEVWKE